MSMQKAQRQMPAQAGREAEGQGEALPVAFSGEAICPRHATGDTGSALLQAALTTENLRRAFKRVRASKGAAGAYVQSGRRIVVDVDLSKFFDRVNHDILIDRLRKRINDEGVIHLVRAI